MPLGAQVARHSASMSRGPPGWPRCALAAAAMALAFLVLSAPYRMKRLTAYQDPWADPFGSGFQLVQSLIAFGQGEWWGVGLGNSVQKLFYLPEAHTDFVFSIWSSVVLCAWTESLNLHQV